MMNSKVIKNASWIIMGRVVQALLNMIVTMLSARYLGPSGYGIINYAAALVAFVVPVMQLGLNATLVQELLQHPEQEGTILGTATGLSFISGGACMIGVLAFAAVANHGEPQTILVCGLYSVLLIFQSLEMVQYWFQAKLRSKYTMMTMLAAHIAVSAYKIFLLVSGKSVYWFAVSQALDYAIISAGLLVIYRYLGGKRFSFSAEMARKMLSRSKYYILSGLMVMLFSQTSRIMLKAMIDEAAVGYYSAAVSCAGMTGFVFSAIIDSARPSILEGKQISQQVFEKRQRLLCAVVIFLALLQSVFVALLAKPIVYILYGSAYEMTIVALQIIVWYTTFSYLGAVRDVWILSEGHQSYLWKINAIGATVNVGLNLLLIPKWGINGAALASLVTQFFTNVILGFLFVPLRGFNRIMLESLDVRFLIRETGRLLKKETQ